MRRSDRAREMSGHWDAGEIIQGLFVGSLRAALDVDQLHSHNVYHVLTAAERLDLSSLPSTISRRQINIADHPCEDLFADLTEPLQYIDNALSQGGCLVHCASGVSRSVSICCVWLMIRKGMTFTDAIDLTRAVRCLASPNVGFKAQLLALVSFSFAHIILSIMYCHA